MKLAIIVVLTLLGTTLLDQVRPAFVESSPPVAVKVTVPSPLNKPSLSTPGAIVADFQGVVVQQAAPVQTSAGDDKDTWMAEAGIPQSDWTCADAIITKESGWKVNAQNPSSSAYGLAQSLPGNKMASAGADWQTNPVTQLKWMKEYVVERYNGFCGAWAHEQSEDWY